MPRGVDLLLPVEWQMIAVFGDDDLREQSWCGDATLLQGVQRGNDGRLVGLITLHILPPDDAAAEEPRRFIVELFGDFFADGAPSFRISNNLIRLDHFIHGGQMLRHSCFALLAWFDLGSVLAALLDLSLQDAGACAGGFGFFCAVITSL